MLIVAGSIAPLKVTVSLLSIGTAVAALTGIVELTVTGCRATGTLMRVFTMVTEAFRASALPSSVTTATLPAVEKVVAAEEIMVPTMVPPPAALIVAVLPTCQNTFLA